MKSPITGKEMAQKWERRELEFRKETFVVIYHYYECAASQMTFTDDRLDTLNLNQVYHQYRAKYGIPFVDELRDLRERYGLSAAKMSEVMGFGTNMWRQYESGEMPTVANGRLIRMASDSGEFEKLVEFSKNALEPHEYERVRRKLMTTTAAASPLDSYLESWMFNERLPSIYNGYRVPNIKRIGTIVKYIAQVAGPYTTALNKLLFYVDFGHFKRYGTGITGLSYAAIQKGPVPENYGSIYDCLYREGYIRIEEVDFKDFTGERFISHGEPISLDGEETPLSETEKYIVKEVASVLGKKSTKYLVQLSHMEDAWLNNQNQFGQINYLYGFSLQGIK